MRAANTLRWGGAIALAALALLRCVVLFAPRVVFDIDPILDPLPLAGLGPAGSLAIDVLVLVAAACVLAGEILSRRGIDVPLVVLLLVPLPVWLLHAAGDGGDAWRGATWFAAMAGAVAIAHVARDVVLRRTVAVLLLAVIAPLLVRGAANVTYEHDQTVRQFETQRDAFFADRGWAPDSQNALVFERRLRQRQPTAWFLTTNIFATFCMFGVLVFAGLAVTAVRAGFAGGWAGLLGLVALACGAGVLMSGSKAAIGVTLLAAALVAVPFVPVVRERWPRLAPWVALVAIALPLLGIAVRGVVLPESFLNDRSLLFRWHYATSSAAMIADAPLAGVGPDGFQAAYMVHRHPRNPEEAASSHSTFLDWVTAFGVAGIAWCAILLTLVWRAGRRWGDLGRETVDAEKVTPLPRSFVAVGAGTGALALLVAGSIEGHALDALDLTVRGLGILAYVGAVGVVAAVVTRATVTVAAGAWIVGALALVMHGHVEMTWTQPGAALWVACVLALAGVGTGGGARGAARTGAGGFAVPAVLLAVSAWLVVHDAWPAARQERAERDAALLIAEAAGTSEAAARVAAADRLADAWAFWPTNVVPRLEVLDQLARAAGATAEPAARAALLERAYEVATVIEAEHGAGGATVDRSFLADALAEIADDAGDADAAADHRAIAMACARRVVELDPNGLVPWRRRADLALKYGLTDESREAYRRVLEIDANLELDPVRRLTDAQRADIERRLTE